MMPMPLGRAPSTPPWPLFRSVWLFCLAVFPAVSAIWLVPGFVTQDGPAHIYNAHILRESVRLGEESPFASAFEARWRPLPNLGGHLTLMGMLTVVSPRDADRAMTTITFAAFALAIVWLRVRVAGRVGLGPAVLLSVVLAINMPWLMGFANFLVGATLALITWGIWWGWRDRLILSRIAAIGGLLVLGYLGHLVSLGITAGGLVVLAGMAPGTSRERETRMGRTLASCVPLIPLALLYKSLATEGGAFEPTWEQTGPFWSPVVWVKRLSWVDPITLGRRDFVPLWPELQGRWCVLLAPSFWLGLGLAILIGNHFNQWRSGETATLMNDRRPWAVLAALLLLGGMIGPDGFGDDHGYFLSQRVVLLGLACLVPALDLDLRSIAVRLATVLITVALVSQSAFVWDYAIEADRRVSPIMKAAPEIGPGARVGTLLIDIRGRYRSNPVLHADCLLGLGSDNILWSNYETRHYYFPVQVRSEIDAPPSNLFEEVAILDDAGDLDRRALLWRDLLQTYGSAIDVVLAWGSDPMLEAITADWAGQGPDFRSGMVQIFRRSKATARRDRTSLIEKASRNRSP
ncbi:hypothetical protein [Tautonia rosea]|uniref:hypothetical protein n=1 Tax=Tautonia rosea TaxID=2728037 RepID=UPI0014747DF7|nr:hypothetical protein [Tautonia rosea]